MTRPRSLLAVASCLLALAGCGSSHTKHSKPMTSGATRRASTTSTTNTAAAEHAALSQFAAAYVRFLDGDSIASELPDATASVRALAGRAGSIPAAHRRGTLVMTQLRPAVGNPGSYLLAARDDAHTFYTQLTLAEQHGHWLVVELTPPDFVQVFAPPGPPPAGAPPGSAAAQDAAQLFLRGYLPWLYGHAPLRAIHDTTRALLADLARRPPRVPLTMRSLHPKLVALALQHHRGGWQALPNMTDGRETYELVLTITQTRGRWLVSGVSNPR
jgi:hypothetical protein